MKQNVEKKSFLTPFISMVEKIVYKKLRNCTGNDTIDSLSSRPKKNLPFGNGREGSTENVPQKKQIMSQVKISFFFVYVY